MNLLRGLIQKFKKPTYTDSVNDTVVIAGFISKSRIANDPKLMKYYERGYIDGKHELKHRIYKVEARQVAYDIGYDEGMRDF